MKKPIRAMILFYNRGKITVTAFLVFVFLLNGFSTKSQHYDKFDRFNSFAISLQGVTYLKGDYNRVEGDYSIKSKLLYSGQLGIKYNLLSASKAWGLYTGVSIGLPPVYSYKLAIKQEDLYTSGTDDAILSDATYSTFSLMIPLAAEYKYKLRENNFLSVSMGLQCMLLGEGSASTTYAMSDDDITREVFMITASNDTPGPYFSGTIGVGDYFLTDIGLWYLGVQFNKSFTTIFSGEYMFGNLANSPDTRGTYKLSGDYISLTLGYSWKKSKKQNRIGGLQM